MAGVIVGINKDDVIVELGPRMQGVIASEEFDAPPVVGQQHDFSVHGREEDGLYRLSLKGAKLLAETEVCRTVFEEDAGIVAEQTADGEKRRATGGARVPIRTDFGATLRHVLRDDEAIDGLGQHELG